MTSRWIRVLLALEAVGLLSTSIWPLVSPRGFYDNFPGAGHHWIDINGPYNEHFLRDFGALNAALLVVLLYAFWKLTPSLVQASALALIVYGVPHVIYHLNHLDVYTGSDKVNGVAPLILQIIGGVILLWLSSRPTDQPLSPSSRVQTPVPDRTT
jgi:hypothetical protein